MRQATGADGIEIASFRSLDWTPVLAAALDEIVFEASATRSFDSAAARAAFRELWLGSYLRLDPDEAFVALDAAGSPAGYVVGALADPAQNARYAELGYFGAFSDYTRRFPAHLHINLAPRYRSQGLGSRLIETFVGHAASRGSPGVHIVTGLGMRNVGFYRRNDFVQVAETVWRGRTLVMLGRVLNRPPGQRTPEGTR